VVSRFARAGPTPDRHTVAAGDASGVRCPVGCHSRMRWCVVRCLLGCVVVAGAAAGCDGDAGKPAVDASAGGAGGAGGKGDAAEAGGGSGGGGSGGGGAGGTGGPANFGGAGGGGSGGDGGGGSGGGGVGGGTAGAGGGVTDAAGPLPDGPSPGGQDMFVRRDTQPVDLPGMPMPSPGAGKKLLPARSELLGVHRAGCSHGAAAPGTTPARWCAISRPAASLGRLELWVLNATAAAAAAAGAEVKCDGTSPHCLRLTDNLFGGVPQDGPAYPDAHRFYGDTLVYYADNLSGPQDLYQGPVYAWRPGWPVAKAIASSRGVLCSAHGSAPVAVCIENISDPAAATVSWDLHAGNIEGGPLRKVATIFPVHPTTEATQWGAAFDSKGETLLFSTPASAFGAESLFFIKVADIGTAAPTPVGAAGVSRWSVNAAGTKWFYLRDYNYNIAGEPSGTLYTRDFPAGAVETAIRGTQVPGGSRGGVGIYQLLVDDLDRDAGLAFVGPVFAGRGDYRIMKDPGGSADDPANVVTVVRDISLRRSPVFTSDLAYLYYVTTVNEAVGTTNSLVAKRDGTGACALTTSLDSYLFGYPFATPAGPALWMDNFDQATDSGEGWLANPAGCGGKRRFATNIDFWFTNNRDLVLYSDSSDGRSVSLRAARLTGGAWPEAPATMATGVGRIYHVVGDFQGVLYQVDSLDEGTSGIYHQPL
jgi:hypothetical protein